MTPSNPSKDEHAEAQKNVCHEFLVVLACWVEQIESDVYWCSAQHGHSLYPRLLTNALQWWINAWTAILHINHTVLHNVTNAILTSNKRMRQWSLSKDLTRSPLVNQKRRVFHPKDLLRRDQWITGQRSPKSVENYVAKLDTCRVLAIVSSLHLNKFMPWSLGTMMPLNPARTRMSFLILTQFDEVLLTQDATIKRRPISSDLLCWIASRLTISSHVLSISTTLARPPTLFASIVTRIPWRWPKRPILGIRLYILMPWALWTSFHSTVLVKSSRSHTTVKTVGGYSRVTPRQGWWNSRPQWKDFML